MKTTQLNTRTLFALLTINFAFLILNCRAQWSAVMVNSNGVLTAPTNLFAANSNRLNVSIGPATSAQLGYSNLIAPGAVYTNDTAGLGTGDDYAVTVTPNATYWILVTNKDNAVYDADLNSVGYLASNGVPLWQTFSTSHNVIYAFDSDGTLMGQPVEEAVTAAGNQSGSFSNLLASQVQASGTISASEFDGTFSGVVSQIPLKGPAPFDFSNGYLPLHESLMARQMPVPFAAYCTWFQYQTGVTNGTVSALACTNMIKQLVTNGLVAAGWNWLEIDEGWSQANFVRSQHPGSVLNCNSNLFPQGIAAVCSYAHANGVKVMLTTFYSDTMCGSSYGAFAGSPPGMLYGDITNILSWGVDGICLDSCGVGTGEQALRGMYLELDSGISHANSHPVADYNDGLPAPQIVPTRVANGRAGVQQWSWAAVEGNIIFDGNESGAGSPLDVYMKNIMACYSNAWLIRPGHYYTLYNLVMDGDQGTNALVYEMTAMAILPMPQDISSISTANVPWFANSDVVSIYQDPAVIPCVLVSNVASAGPIFVRQLGYNNGPVHAVAMFNTNTTSSESMIVSALSCGISNDVPFTVWDSWSHANLGIYENSFTANIPTNSARLYKLIATPNLIGGLIATNQSANLSSTLIYTNATGGPVHLNVGLDTEVTTTSAGGTISSTVTATNNSSGQYSYSTALYSAASPGYYSTNWLMVVSNGTQVTVTTTISGSPHYTLYSRVAP